MDLSKSQLENHYASVFGRPLPRVILVLSELTRFVGTIMHLLPGNISTSRNSQEYSRRVVLQNAARLNFVSQAQ